MTNNDSGSFTFGFIFGVFVATSGYFITQTTEGKKLKQRFLEEWGGIQQRLQDEGILSPDAPEVTDYISIIKQKIAQYVDGDQSTQQKPKKKQSSKKLFKGI